MRAQGLFSFTKELLYGNTQYRNHRPRGPWQDDSDGCLDETKRRASR